MLSLFIRNLFFTVLQPGLVAGLIPLWITGIRVSEILEQVWNWQHYLGTIVFLIGFIIMLWCIISFAIKGRGTLSPADPTQKLVVLGLYRFSRNPMYVGVVGMLIGEAIYFQSINLCVYAFVVFAGFHLFVLLHEEPRLKRDFGEEYERYFKEVRRWI